MEIAIEEINAGGGFKAEGKTYKLELLMYDDQYTGQAARPPPSAWSIRTR